MDGTDVLGHGHDAGGIPAVGRAQHGFQLLTADRQTACGDLGKDAFFVRLQTVFQVRDLLAQAGNIFLQAAARGLERVPVRRGGGNEFLLQGRYLLALRRYLVPDGIPAGDEVQGLGIRKDGEAFGDDALEFGITERQHLGPAAFGGILSRGDDIHTVVQQRDGIIPDIDEGPGGKDRLDMEQDSQQQEQGRTHALSFEKSDGMGKG